jgi:serine/threonine-protein kinase
MGTTAPDAPNVTSERFSLVGESIADRYRILAPISRGAMGEVYRAEQVQLNREVAVKVLYATGSAAERREFHDRFILEAASLAKLSHPNTVRVFDFGFHGGRPFLVMELVDGCTLRSLTHDTPLAPERAVVIALQIAGALREAHDSQLLHRDLKTSNILVTKDADGNDQVKVIDFGLVRDLESDDEGLTQAGLVLGTPMYIAPELIEGARGDHRADIYSLGVVLYRCLTGKPPFSKEGGPRHILRRILASDAPPLAEAQPDLEYAPRCLEWTVRTCLSKDPDTRFGSMRELQRALRACRLALTDPEASAMSLRLVDGATVLPEWAVTQRSNTASVPFDDALTGSVRLFRSGQSGSYTGLTRPNEVAHGVDANLGRIAAMIGIPLLFAGAWFAMRPAPPPPVAVPEPAAVEQTETVAKAPAAPAPVETAPAAAEAPPREPEAQTEPAATEVVEAEIETPEPVATPAPAPKPRPRARAKPKPKPAPAPTPAPEPEPAPSFGGSDLKNPFD